MDRYSYLTYFKLNSIYSLIFKYLGHEEIDLVPGRAFTNLMEKCCNYTLFNIPHLYSHTLLGAPRRPTRKVSESPFKVLDASGLQDDFYLNLVDWSSLNVLGVGLGSCVYMWSAYTSQVQTCTFKFFFLILQL